MSTGNVRRRTAKERVASPQANFNRMSDYVTHNAKFGAEAKDIAKERTDQNKAAKEFGMSKPKTVKIDSNPVKPGKTRIGPLGRGGAGLGGLLGSKIR